MAEMFLKLFLTGVAFMSILGGVGLVLVVWTE